MYGVFCSESVKIKRENTTYVTIFWGPQKFANKMCCNNNKNKNNNHNNNNNKNKNKKKKKKKKRNKYDKKMRYKLRYDKNIILYSAPARTRRAHEQHQRSHC